MLQYKPTLSRFGALQADKSNTDSQNVLLEQQNMS